MIIERATQMTVKLTDEIEAKDPGILQRYPIQHYIDYIRHYPPFVSYKHIGHRIKTVCQNIVEAGGNELLELYHKLLMATMISHAGDDIQLGKLPLDVRKLIDKNYERIIKKLELGHSKVGYYLYSEDKFNKDLSICTLKMIPLGAQKVYAGRMSRRFPLKGGPAQFINGLKVILFETHGFKPMFRMHMDSRDRDVMKEFNPDGWRRFYKRAALMLKAFPEVKGICGSAWFWDPVLKEISPELSYLRELALEHGGHFFHQGHPEHAKVDAVFMSRKRQELVDQGKYNPAYSLMVIGRETLIQRVGSEI